MPLRSLFKSYGKEARLSPATVKRWTPVVERLIGHLGHDDARAISRADIVAWKDVLLEGGMKNITVRDVYLAATKAMLQFAVDQGLLAENLAKEVKVRVRKKVKEREKGFDGEEAAKILAATRGPFSHLISVEMKAARRWLPWIGAYTGARINELTPLTAADFVKRDGIWMIRIRGANAKTRSYREVPLHGHLIEQGLLDYAKSRGKRPLFYDPARSRGAKDSNPHHQKVAERIAEWVRSLGIEGVAPIMAGVTASPASPATSACLRTSATSSRVTPARRSPTNTARPGRLWRSARLRSCPVTCSEIRRRIGYPDYGVG